MKRNNGGAGFRQRSDHQLVTGKPQAPTKSAASFSSSSGGVAAKLAASSSQQHHHHQTTNHLTSSSSSSQSNNNDDDSSSQKGGMKNNQSWTTKHWLGAVLVPAVFFLSVVLVSNSNYGKSVEEVTALTAPDKDSPWRDHPTEDHLKCFEEMRGGNHADGSMVLRAKINMASPNINLRDPAIYRIKNVSHHKTGDKWSIYPMYTFAHPIEDALEGITHSVCTLEFEDQRPFYDWLLKRLKENNFFSDPLPKQYEFARLNLTYVVLSKRRLIELVENKHVSGWDDPRMPTLVGSKRRGYTPSGFKLFTDRIGVSKADSWIDYVILEDCMREVLNESAHRRVAVLDPVKLIINNYPEDQEEDCFAPNHPKNKDLGERTIKLTKELWIDKDDFMEVPVDKYFRLSPGAQVRLRYGFVIECTGFEKDIDGNITNIFCDYLPDTKSGTPGADAIKVKGNIHWLSCKYAVTATVNLYDRLFKEAHPGENNNYLDDLNPDSLTTREIKIEENLKTIVPGDQYQFERHGYFIADNLSKPDDIILNRTTTLRDNWQ